MTEKLEYPEHLVPFMEPAEVAELDQHYAARFGHHAVRLWRCQRVMEILTEAEARKKAKESQS